MNFRKFFGWILILVGLMIIFWSLYNSFNIFRGKIEAPAIFKISEKETLPASKFSESKIKTELKVEIEKMVQEQLKSLIPPDFLPKLLNLISWSIFASLLIFAGAKISSLGIKLTK
jgi:hypothetical protein